MKKLLALAVLLVTAAVCAGCGSSALDAERLLSPPALSEEDMGVLGLFESQVGKGLQFIYPAKGKNRSPILRVGLGPSGEPGFLVLTRSAPEDRNVTLSFVSARPDYNIIGSFALAETSSLESIDFADLNGDGSAEIIAVSLDYEGNKTASVHKVLPDFTQELFRAACGEAAVSSLAGDRARLFLVKKDESSDKAEATMVCAGENGDLVTEKISLAVGKGALLSVKAGMASPGSPALAVECFDGSQTVTRLALWDAGSANPKLTAADADIPPRQGRLACEDMDSDGVLEFPYEAADYYKIGTAGVSPVYMRVYEWRRWKGEGQLMERAAVRAENIHYRYAFTIPDALTGKILIEQAATGELHFYLRSEQTIQFFSLVSMERAAFDARAAIDSLTLLVEDGAMVHALSVPAGLSDEAKALLPGEEQFKKAVAPHIGQDMPLI